MTVNPSFSGVPGELTTRDQWICWRNECRGCGDVLDPETKECEDCGEKTTKRPINPDGGGFSKTDDPSTWADFDTAVTYNDDSDTHGVGFVFSDDDPIVGVDIDDCRDPETGEISDSALDIVTRLHSFTEVSPSGTGLHVYAFGELPEGGNRHGGVEMYETERYFTVTGDSIPQSPADINYREDEIAAVHSGYVEGSGSGGSEVVDYVMGDVPEDADTFENGLGETLEEIRDRDDKLDRLLTELEGEYESASEADMAAVSKLWFWKFDRDDIAGIIRAHRRRPKVVERDDYLELTIGKAATGEQVDDRRTFDDVEVLDDRQQYESIGQASLPTTGHFVLDKPPREGGSHASIDHLSDQPLVILASRHSICEHHLEILDKVMPEGKTAVHRVGSGRACRSSGDDCPRRRGSEDYAELFEVIHAAKDAIAENRIITKEDCPDRFCPDQFLAYAEEYAHAAVTVPNLLTNLNRDLDGNNLLIDEEQALAYFRPPSVDLAEIETVYEPDGTRRVQVADSNISDQLDTLEDIRDRVFDEQQDRAEENDNWRETQEEKDILNAIGYLEDVADCLAVGEIAAELDSPGTKDVVDEIRDRVDDLDRPEPNLNPGKFREKIEDYVERYYFDDSVDPGAMMECVLFGYEDRPIDFKRTGESYKLRLIGGRDIFHVPKIARFEQIGIIAGPEGELFFDDLGAPATVIEITDFEYGDDFVVVPVGKDDDTPKDQRKRAKRVSKILNHRAHPHLAVAGTKGRAKAHHSWLDTGTADIIASPESPAKDIFATWTVGGSAIIYENSAVSRGIDAPQFDISVVVSSGFATPYWEARAAHYRGEDEEEHEYARAIEAQLKAHELTNAVLRPAPTRHVDDVTGTKFIVAAEWDVPRLHYLDQQTPTFPKAKSAASFVQQLTVEGGIRAEIDDVYWDLGGSESEFIKTALTGQFKEQVHDRPTYDHDELESWCENKFFHGEGVVEQVERAVPPGGVEVETGYVTNLFDSWPNGKTSVSLDILERKGILHSDKRSDTEHGGPYRVWSKESFKSEDG